MQRRVILQIAASAPAWGIARLDSVVDPLSVPEKVAGGFLLKEGPVYHRSGFLLFSDVAANTILRLDRTRCSVYRRGTNARTGLLLIEFVVCCLQGAHPVACQPQGHS